MNEWRKLTAKVLCACLVHLLIADTHASLQARDLPQPESVRAELDGYGVGAELKLKLAGGKKLRGSVDKIADDAFVLALKEEGQSRRIAYGEVAELKLARNTYRASGEPDPLQARRVVMALGVGEHVMVKVGEGRKLRGHIQAIGNDQFTLLPDLQQAAVQVPYSEVRQVGKNLSAGATLAVVVGIAAVVAVVIILVTRDDPFADLY